MLTSFCQMGDGSFLAFFEAPDQPFEFKEQHDFDLHIALEVDSKTLKRIFNKGKALRIETRGISDHGFIQSIYAPGSLFASKNTRLGTDFRPSPRHRKGIHLPSHANTTDFMRPNRADECSMRQEGRNSFLYSNQ